MNADAEENKEIASEVGVSGFPTIKFFPKDGSEPVTYSKARSEEAFVEVRVRPPENHTVAVNGANR
jgi:protein disulfide-isomerase A6